MMKQLVNILKRPLFSIVFLCLAIISLAACGSYGSNGPGAPSTATTAPFKVTGVDLAVSPNSIAGKACGSSVSFTYTATFHIAANSPGGTIQFMYTVNNGRGSTNASVNVGAGKTTATYTFTSSGTLPSDHTYPGIAEVVVNSPNAVNSPQVQPAGTCTVGAAFQVTSVDLAVSPNSIAGKACGSQVSFTYTTTFHIAANSPGGTIQFMYTVNNGRGSTNASVKVGAGKTIATYTFTSSGTLPPDHTYPGIAEVVVNSPNAINSPQVQPAGSCTPVSGFQVTSIDMAVSPANISGMACGTHVTVTYTATFHIAANSPGGTLKFMYTVNNGRGSTNASVPVGAGKTIATYSFTWSGNLPLDHTYPGRGGVMLSSPNTLTSALVAPTGTCS